MNLRYTLFLIIFLLVYSPRTVAAEDEFVTFAKKIEQTIGNRDTQFFNEAFDVGRFLDKVVHPSTNKEMKSFNEGFKESFEAKFKPGDVVMNAIGADGFYSYLNHYVKDGQHHILFRMFSSSTGINYHDLELEKVNGVIKVTDIYIYLSGEWLSQTIKALYIALVPATLGKSDNDLEQMTAKGKEYSKINQVRALLANKDFDEANKIFQSISEEARRAKPFQIIYLQVARGLGDEPYLKAMQEYEAAFPSDASLDLISLDYYYLKEDYQSLLDLTDRLDQRLQTKDPLLNLFRGNCHFFMANLEKAIEAYRVVVSHFPRLESGHTSLAISYIQLGDFKSAVSTFDGMVEKLGVSKSDIHEMFADQTEFVASDEYRKWKNK